MSALARSPGKVSTNSFRACRGWFHGTKSRLLAGDYAFREFESLSPDERDVLLDSATVLFLEHNVCFRETDPLNSRTYLVFPELINLKRPPVDEEMALEEGVAYTVTGSVEN